MPRCRSGIQIITISFAFRHHATTRYTFANFEPGLPAVQAAQAAQGQLTHGAHGDCELEISHLGEITSRRRAPRVLTLLRTRTRSRRPDTQSSATLVAERSAHSLHIRSATFRVKNLSRISGYFSYGLN